MSEQNQQDQVNPYAASTAELRTESSSTETKLASRGARFGAALIDGLILGGISTALIVTYFGGWAQYLQAAQDLSFTFKLVITLIGIAIYFVLNGKFLADNGQTIGKKVLSIKIIRSDGSKPSLAHIMGRRYAPVVIAQNIPVIGMILPLVDALFIFRDSHQCLHDTIADTIVVEAN